MRFSKAREQIFYFRTFKSRDFSLSANFAHKTWCFLEPCFRPWLISYMISFSVPTFVDWFCGSSVNSKLWRREYLLKRGSTASALPPFQSINTPVVDHGFRSVHFMSLRVFGLDYPSHTHAYVCELTLLSGCRPHHHTSLSAPLPLPCSVLLSGASTSQSAGCISPLSSASAGGRDWLVWSELGRQMKCQVRSASGDNQAAS